VNDKQKKVVQQVRDNMVKKSLCFNQCFSTPAGKEVLEKLKEEFDPVALCPDGFSGEGVIARAAQRDVIKYIETMVNLREVTENAT